MILKLIVCDVPEEKRERFSRAQAQWTELAGVDGFAGQAGGWESTNRQRAVVIGLWRSKSYYDRFMRDVHDAIVESNRQDECYDSCRVTLWDCLFDIAGPGGDVAAALQASRTIRLARSAVSGGRDGEPAGIPSAAWKPDSVETKALLGGTFCRNRSDSKQILICTLWGSEPDHSQTVETIFGLLRNHVGLGPDCELDDHLVVQREPAWDVLTQPGTRAGETL